LRLWQSEENEQKNSEQKQYSLRLAHQKEGAEQKETIVRV
jgi:hypothetical protein